MDRQVPGASAYVTPRKNENRCAWTCWVSGVKCHVIVTSFACSQNTSDRYRWHDRPTRRSTRSIATEVNSPRSRSIAWILQGLPEVFHETLPANRACLLDRLHQCVYMRHAIGAALAIVLDGQRSGHDRSPQCTIEQGQVEKEGRDGCHLKLLT